MRVQVTSFAAMALIPAALCLLAAWGGVWVWLAVLYLGLVVAGLDLVLPAFEADAPEGAEFPGSDALLAVIAVITPVLMALVVINVWRLDWAEAAALILAAGFWLGQVAHPAAHELIHRADRRLFRLGIAVYGVLAMGHHVSSHRLVHHVHVATLDDPATARSGQGFWRFLLRAELEGFRKGLAAETALRARRAKGLHPYVLYAGITGLAAMVALALGGGPGLAVWALLCLHTKLQIHLSDYVQHYGLQRRRLPDGRLEPVGPRHSWNGGQWLSGRMMLNAPRHSDHHAHPLRPYPALRLPGVEDAPRLPLPLPLACTLALVPPLWRRVMRPHVARWRQFVEGVTGTAALGVASVGNTMSEPS
jgi:alkane 1-monooxygenase